MGGIFFVVQNHKKMTTFAFVKLQIVIAYEYNAKIANRHTGF